MVTALYLSPGTDLAQLTDDAIDAMGCFERVNVFRAAGGSVELLFSARRTPIGFQVVAADHRGGGRFDTAERAIEHGMRAVRGMQGTEGLGKAWI